MAGATVGGQTLTRGWGTRMGPMSFQAPTVRSLVTGTPPYCATQLEIQAAAAL